MLRFFDLYLTIFLALIILIGALSPVSEVAAAPAGTDKIIHIVAFAALVFPLALTKRIGLFTLFIFASLFGGVIEIIQPSFGRDIDFYDWVSDNLGILCGFGLGHLESKRRV